MGALSQCDCPAGSFLVDLRGDTRFAGAVGAAGSGVTMAAGATGLPGAGMPGAPEDAGGIMAAGTTGLPGAGGGAILAARRTDRKSTRLNSRHRCISYAVFCLK